MALVWRDYRQGGWTHSILWTHEGRGVAIAQLAPVTYKDHGPVIAVVWDIDEAYTGILGEDGAFLEGREDTRREAKRAVRKALREHGFKESDIKLGEASE